MPSAFEHGPTLTVVASPTANAGVIWSAANNLGQSTILLGTGTLGISGDTDIITLTANTVTVAGTVAATTLTGNGAGVTALAAANITANGTLPALNGAALTALNGSNIASGTVPVDRLGSGSPGIGNYLRGDGSWQAVSGGAAISGTPANNQVAVWTDASTIEGDSEFTWTESVLTVKQGASGGASGYNAKLIVESNTHAGISILAPDNSEMNLTFASPSQAQLAGIVANYNSNSEYMSWVVAGAEKMRIQSTGDVGIGTTSPAAKLHVLTGNDNAILLESSNDNYYQFTMRNTTHTTNTHAKLIMHCYQDFVLINNARYDSQGTGAYLNLNCNAAVGIGTNSPSSSYKLDVGGSVHGSSHPTSSDERLKTNITELTGVLPKLANIRAVKFNWDTTNVSEERAKGYGTALEIGMIAQDIEAEFPEIITKWLDGDEGHAADNEFRAVEYGRFTSILLAAIKELKAEIDELKG